MFNKTYKFTTTLEYCPRKPVCSNTKKRKTIMKNKNQLVRLALIGAGMRGANQLAKSFHNPQGRSVIVAAADTNETMLAEAQKKLGDPIFTTADYRRLLDRQDIDAVVVTSPDHLHEEHAVAALEAGKHVYCEKPLAITVEACDRILKAWKKSGKKLMVGFNMRYMNIFRSMKEIADSGAIGVIKAVWVRHFVASGGRWYFHDWHANRKNTTSLLLQKASHDIDMIHWISGHYTKRVAAFGSLDYYGGTKANNLRCPDCPEKNKCPEFEIWPNHDYCVFRKEVSVEDNSVVMMELDNGIKAVYTQCHFTPDYFRNYTFIGTEGRMENLNDDSKVIVLMRSRSKKWKNLANRTYEIIPAQGGHGGADPLILTDFLDMITLNKPPVATPVAGRMSVATGVAATQSLRSGGRVIGIKPLPPQFKKATG